MFKTKFFLVFFCTESNLGYFFDKSTTASVHGFCVSTLLRLEEVIKT